MLKQVTQTDKIKSQIAAAYGEPDVDTSKLAVFEAIAANTRPLLRDRGLFAKAVIQPDKLRAMDRFLAAGNHVPLQTMHAPGIPKGKVFASSVKTTDGETSLHTLFYLPTSEAELVNKLDADVIGEVSIGSTPSKLLCSECGWDYNGDDSTFDNVWDCVCANDHKIGKKGVHLKLSGLKQWHELSLVDRGATDGAKVLGRHRQRMSSPDKLAARGFDESVLTLFASANLSDPPGPRTTVMTVDVEKYVALSGEVAVLKHTATEITTKLTAAETSVTDLRAQLATKDAEIATLKAGDLVKITAERDELKAYVAERLTAAYALTGKAGTAIPELVSDQVKALRQAQTDLALSLPMGGRSLPAGQGGGPEPVAARSAFKRS